eukprot:1999224-Amphidinium_carterae.1
MLCREEPFVRGASKLVRLRNASSLMVGLCSRIARTYLVASEIDLPKNINLALNLAFGVDQSLVLLPVAAFCA